LRSFRPRRLAAHYSSTAARGSASG
jgi:hypothetical protein